MKGGGERRVAVRRGALGDVNNVRQRLWWGWATEEGGLEIVEAALQSRHELHDPVRSRRNLSWPVKLLVNANYLEALKAATLRAEVNELITNKDPLIALPTRAKC